MVSSIGYVSEHFVQQRDPLTISSLFSSSMMRSRDPLHMGQAKIDVSFFFTDTPSCTSEILSQQLGVSQIE